ncbi:hypothetical protein KC345_g5397 [Hortaea werneckii]|nr:hypothetical protein KC345_g5397 [Hortaea werneckii]
MHRGINGSVIVAIVLAAVAACAIVFAALWYTRYYWMVLLPIKRHANTNSSSNHDSQEDTEGGNVDAASTQALPDTGSAQARHGSRMSTASPEPAKDDDGNSLSIGQASSSRCTPIGLDHNLRQIRRVSVRGHLLPSSPRLSRLKLPQISVSPATNDSLPPQDSSRLTGNLIPPTSDTESAAYTPSVSSKGDEPTASVGPRRTSAPLPTLSQEYSAKRLGSDSDIYRSASVGREPSSAYLGLEGVSAGKGQSKE